MISVLVATYNGEKYIVEQLESIRRQTVRPDEVVICDDFSTDGTVNVVEEYLQKHKLYSWRLEKNVKNLGHYHTFLNLVQKATGDYIFFSDQDDVWRENKIEVLLKQLQDSKVAMVYCRSSFINHTGSLIKSVETSGDIFEREFITLLQDWPSGYQMAFPSNVLKDILGNRFHTQLGFDYHDVLFGMIAGLYGKVICVDKVLDYHRIHADNVTLSSKSRSLSQDRFARIQYLKKMQKRLESVYKIAEIRDNVEYKQEIKYIQVLTNDRIELLSTKSIILVWKLFKKRNYYRSKKDYISDLLYTFSVNNIIAFFRNLSGKLKHEKHK